MNVPSDSLGTSGHRLSVTSSQVKHEEEQNKGPDYWHKMFRSFSPSEGSHPIQQLRRISQLCYRWLRPDLNSKEEILDQLVLEQFLICMPLELQAFLKESGVKSCKDLEEILRDRKCHNWSIVYSQGQAYLCQDPKPSDGKAEDPEEKWDPLDLSQGHLSNESKESLNRGRASLELQNLSATEEPSSSQEEDILLKVIPERRQPDYLRPEQSLGKYSVPDWKEAEASLSVGQDPHPTQGPAGSPRVKSAVRPQEDTVVDAVPSFTPILERDLALNRDLQSLRGFNLPPFQGLASYMGNTEDGLEAANPEPANPEPANPQPVEEVNILAPQTRFLCTKCKKSFLYRSHFNLHQRSHTGERPFKCNLCNKAFLQSSDLKVHQRVHTGEKPYKCAVCGMKFAHRSTLKGHSRVHTKEKPYVCKDCGQRFHHRGDLNTHFRIHRDTRPYDCKKCNKAFRQLGTWKRHVETHLSKASV